MALWQEEWANLGTDLNSNAFLNMEKIIQM